jgi:TldD protein
VQRGEVRVVEQDIQWLRVRNGQLELQTRTLDRGIGVRVLDGGWGFAASRDLNGATAVAEQAVILARATAPHAYADIDLGEHPPAVGQWSAPVDLDPFEVPLADKVDLLQRASASMAGADIRESTTVCMRTRTSFRSTDGSDWQQEQVITGLSIQAIAKGEGRFQVRSWPKAQEGNPAGRGWEHVLAHDVDAKGPELADQARSLLHAPPVPSGTWDVILDHAQLSLQIHESVGHPVEGDRVLGEEMSLAGGSFLQPGWRQERFGSDRVHLYAEATSEGAAGSFGWDDEGSPATRVDLVRDGHFTGWLSGRESSSRLATPHAAAMRADGWSHPPIVRMVNVNLAPGEAGTLDDLVASTERGLLLSRNRSWSIDQLRLNFQFGCEAAWEIQDGAIVGLYRDPVYTGVTPQFWQSCDAICSQSEWQQWGWAFCGKGDPMQIMHVSHGCAPARFRGVELL